MSSLPRKALIAVSGANPPFYLDGRKTGLSFPEALLPYNMLVGAGFEIDIASETGSFAYDDHSLEPHHLSREDQRILRNSSYSFHEKINQQLFKAGDLAPHDYGLFFAAGGHGAMYDFPHAHHLQAIAEDIYNRGGVVGAVDQAPVILAGMHTPEGDPILKDKEITGFTTKGEVELKVIDKIRDDGLRTVEEMAQAVNAHYLPPSENFDDFSHIDSRIVTGANATSTRSTVKNAIKVFEGVVGDY
ncbi:uncharacterized protein PADG_11179 [Paracoccidioides brasiliensis Pb18]|uniref:D-lactate dehydratase n=2 Tax=Paracoccidioides brasiliensis TaxID=121759 RepID=A0A0A0HXF3_PARBD|nr:uncharacterized protein PADG_11179 [Paracoccidioides brasiliensis Pb18]KGM92721.1 hypothetical protein PADG_11179 [Paracoccidioides brasiliensis Pb18]ODH46597.1 hypothetical protein GX48_07292 [Paracoccidioides brasiliensis]